MENTEPNQIPPEHLESYLELGRILKGIHIRLIMEGYIIEDGKPIIPPPDREKGSSK